MIFHVSFVLKLCRNRNWKPISARNTWITSPIAVGIVGIICHQRIWPSSTPIRGLISLWRSVSITSSQTVNVPNFFWYHFCSNNWSHSCRCWTRNKPCSSADSEALDKEGQSAVLFAQHIVPTLAWTTYCPNPRTVHNPRLDCCHADKNEGGSHLWSRRKFSLTGKLFRPENGKFSLTGKHFRPDKMTAKGQFLLTDKLLKPDKQSYVPLSSPLISALRSLPVRSKRSHRPEVIWLMYYRIWMCHVPVWNAIFILAFSRFGCKSGAPRAFQGCRNKGRLDHLCYRPWFGTYYNPNIPFHYVFCIYRYWRIS